MKKIKKEKPVLEDSPDGIASSHNSTTQGGSNFGQGSSQLENNSRKQGSELGDGANYESEDGWNNEALRQEDMNKTGGHQSDNTE